MVVNFGIFISNPSHDDPYAIARAHIIIWQNATVTSVKKDVGS